MATAVNQGSDAQTVVNDIGAYINQQGSPRSSWYVGITSDIEARLFGAHQVPRNHWWIWRKAVSADAARSAETGLHNGGCDGGPGGGDDGCRYVYAYLKTSVTSP